MKFTVFCVVTFTSILIGLTGCKSKLSKNNENLDAYFQMEDEIYEAIYKLHHLRMKGKLTEEEYIIKKQKAIDDIQRKHNGW